jgi:hypothetical protein
LFNSIELAGSGCGRQLEVAAQPYFQVSALRLRVTSLAKRNRLIASRYTVSDRCNSTSVVNLRKGRLQVADHGKRATYVLNGRRTYVARGRG